MPERVKQSFFHIFMHDLLYFLNRNRVFIFKPPADQRHHVGRKRCAYSSQYVCFADNSGDSVKFFQNLPVKPDLSFRCKAGAQWKLSIKSDILSVWNIRMHREIPEGI